MFLHWLGKSLSHSLHHIKQNCMQPEYFCNCKSDEKIKLRHCHSWAWFIFRGSQYIPKENASIVWWYCPVLQSCCQNWSWLSMCKNSFSVKSFVQSRDSFINVYLMAPGYRSNIGKPFHSIYVIQIFFLCVLITEFFQKNWRTQVPFLGSLIPLFWTSGDVCPECQIQGGFLACVRCHLCAMDSSDSPLVLHLLTSWQSAWQLIAFPTCM